MATNTASGAEERSLLTEDQQPPRRERTPAPSVAIAVVVTGAAIASAVALRWFHLGGQSLYVDEGQTNFAANLSPANIVRFAQSSDAPPLYFLLEHFWIALLGNSEYALRALSALFGTLSLPVFYLLAKKLLQETMAVALAMWLFAFSLVQVWYCREARTYELASFLAVVSLYALVLFLGNRSVKSFATIVLCATMSLYAHNMMLFYVFALNVIWLTYPSERTWKQRTGELLVADAFIGVLYLPWVSSLVTQASVDVVQKYFWAPRPTVRTLFQTMGFIAGFNTDYLSWLPGRFLPLSTGTTRVLVVGLVSLLCVALLAGGLWRVPKRDRNRNISFLLFGLIPIIGVFVLSQITTPLFIDRIFTNSSAVVPLVFAYPLALHKERNGRIWYGLLSLALAVTTSLSAFGYLRYQQKDDWRDAISRLLRIPERNRLIVFIPRMGEPLFDYYAHRFSAKDPGLGKMALPVSYLASFPPPRGGQIHAAEFDKLKLAVESGKYAEIDLLLSYELHDDPNETVLNYLSQVFVRGEEQRFSGVRFVRFMAPPH